MDPLTPTAPHSTTPSSTTTGWWSPFSVALWVMLCFAILYEPVRQILLHAQISFNVGGVGGVGGLANLAGQDHFCTSPNSTVFGGQYCYEKGSWGPLTPFQMIFLAFWVGPLVLAACLSPCWSRSASSHSGPIVSNSSTVGWLTPVWLGMNVVWFIHPLVQFGLGLKEINVAWTRMVLSVSLAAAHPLSWNLALVMIPTGGVLSKLILGEQPYVASKKYWFEFHRLLGYTTTFWGLLHGVGELLFLFSTKDRFRNLWEIATNGEVLLYWSGIASFFLLAGHAGAAYLRRRWTKPGEFALIHRLMASALLLMAAAHWWPFCMFFLPATSIHGIAFADRRHKLVQERLSVMQVAFVFTSALMAGLLGGFRPVWSLRQNYMQSSGANLYVPFVFPPLGVAASWMASWTSTQILLHFLGDEEATGEHHQLQPTGREEPTTEDGVRTPLLTGEV